MRFCVYFDLFFHDEHREKESASSFEKNLLKGVKSCSPPPPKQEAVHVSLKEVPSANVGKINWAFKLTSVSRLWDHSCFSLLGIFQVLAEEFGVTVLKL